MIKWQTYITQFLAVARDERVRAFWADTQEQRDEAVDRARFYLARAREANAALAGQR